MLPIIIIIIIIINLFLAHRLRYVRGLSPYYILHAQLR